MSLSQLLQPGGRMWRIHKYISLCWFLCNSQSTDDGMNVLWCQLRDMWVCLTHSKQKPPPPPNTQRIVDNEVKEQWFTDSLFCPTGLCWNAATWFQFRLVLFFGLVVPAWLPAARALERGHCSGGRGAPVGCGGGGGGWLGVDVWVVVVVSSRAVVGESGRGGGGRGPLGGLCLGRPRRWDGPHHVGGEGGCGGDGDSGIGAGGGGEGVGGWSPCRLGDGFWWREGQEARNGWMTEQRWKCLILANKPHQSPLMIITS